MQTKLVSFFQTPIFGATFPTYSKPQRVPNQHSITASAEHKKPDFQSKSASNGTNASKIPGDSSKDQNKTIQALPIPSKPLFPSSLSFLWFNQGKKKISDPISNDLPIPVGKPKAHKSKSNAETTNKSILEANTDKNCDASSISKEMNKSKIRNRVTQNLTNWREEDLIDHEKLCGDPEVVHGIENSMAKNACAAAAAESLMEIKSANHCIDCDACNVEYEGDSGSDSDLKEKKFRGITHTAETFMTFVKQAPLEELRTASLMSVLSDLAYTIKAINTEELFRKYGLVMVTSSNSRKKRQDSEEKTSTNSQNNGDEKTNLVVKNSEKGKESKANYAYAFASAAVAYIQSQSLSILPIKSNISKENSTEKHKNDKPLEASNSKNLPLLKARTKKREEYTPSSDLNIQTNSYVPIVQFQPQLVSPPLIFSTDSTKNEVQHTSKEGAKDAISESNSSENGKVNLNSNVDAKSVASLLSNPSQIESEEADVSTSCDLIESESSTAMEDAAKNSGMDTSCPCDWFVCDDSISHTRYFVIQGSDSIASWQTNISFDPVVFEKPELNVMVHRGIYDAAKSLYNSLLPLIQSHVCRHGSSARISFTGHSLGGSLATLLMLMLKIRLNMDVELFNPVYTFGSPSIMCGGDSLLDRLGFSRMHLRQVMMHRDLVPRAFACDYPDHVADVLRRINGAFRHHPCLQHQKLMYSPMGTALILQPKKEQAPFHHLLPLKSGLFYLQHPLSSIESAQLRSSMDAEVRSALLSLLNSPHPLEILSDPGAYGTDGSISRYHNPNNYCNALHEIFKSHLRQVRIIHRSRRRNDWVPLVTGKNDPSGKDKSPLSEEFKEATSPSFAFSKSYSDSNLRDLMRKRRKRRLGSDLPRAMSAEDLSPSLFSTSFLNQSSIGRWNKFVASRHISFLMFFTSSCSYFYSTELVSRLDCNLFTS